jgi:hypothetical protein
MRIDYACRYCPYLTLKFWNGVEIIIETFERSSVLFLGPCTCNNSMVSMIYVTTKVLFESAVRRLTERLYQFVCPHHISISFYSTSQNNRAHEKWQKSWFLVEDDRLKWFQRIQATRQDIWAKLRYGNVPLWVQKLTRNIQMSKQNDQKERKKYIQSDQPAWKPGGASAKP